jgi:hypothetical protein
MNRETRSVAGGVPEPEDLFGREHVIGFIWEQLAANNVLIVAPRRFGKTGVMAHLLKRPRDAFLPIYLEVEDHHDPDRFAAALLAALLEHENLRSLLMKAKALPGLLRGGFPTAFSRTSTRKQGRRAHPALSSMRSWRISRRIGTSFSTLERTSTISF